MKTFKDYLNEMGPAVAYPPNTARPLINSIVNDVVEFCFQHNFTNQEKLQLADAIQHALSRK